MAGRRRGEREGGERWKREEVRSEMSSEPEVKVVENLGSRKLTRTRQIESKIDGYAKTYRIKGKLNIWLRKLP